MNERQDDFQDMMPDSYEKAAELYRDAHACDYGVPEWAPTGEDIEKYYQKNPEKRRKA